LAQNTGAPAGKAPPKLVLFMVIDGFPQEQLVKYYDLYGERGLKLFLDKGGWYGNNHYSHATTCPSRKSYPRVAMMQPRQNRRSDDGPASLDRSM
jgi:hypothetical protein